MEIFAVRCFGTSAEVERCPFVNTFRARHTDAILLSRSMSFWKYSSSFFVCGFFHKIFYFFYFFIYFLCSRKHFSLFSLSLSLSVIVSLMSLLSHCGNLDVLPACALKVPTENSETDIVPCRQGFIGISTVQDFSEQGPVQVIKKGSLIKMFERSK